MDSEHCVFIELPSILLRCNLEFEKGLKYVSLRVRLLSETVD